MLVGKEQLQFGQMSLSDGNKQFQSDEISLSDRNKRFQFGEISLSDENKHLPGGKMSLSDRNEQFQFTEMSLFKPVQEPEEKSLDPMIQSLLGQLLDCGAQIPIKNDLPTIQNPTSRDATFGLTETSGVMTVQVLESLQIDTSQNSMEQIVKNQISIQNRFRSTTF
jgi:hypothetical protein